ncbi:ATP-binding protein [Pseudomonas sp. 3A(2025)]
MLIEFSVTNYKSFRDRQTLSMVAAPRLGKKKNTFKPELDGENFPALLKVAAIYGSNASGKSSLAAAINFVPKMILHRTPDDEIPVSPFRFDSELMQAPSRFEYNFISEGVRYEYLVSATCERITYESLVVYPKGKALVLYSRKYSIEEGEVYVFGSGLEGNSILHEAWRDLTGPGNLFLYSVGLHSSESFNQITAAYRWFKSRYVYIGQDGMRNWSMLTRSHLQKYPEMNEDLERFLFDLDVPITKIDFEKIPNPARQTDDGSKAPRGHWAMADKEFKTRLTHTTALGSAEFGIEEESGGTQNLMGFWLPWKWLTATSPRLVVVDEFDSSLHPKIVERLISKLLDEDGEGQLLFTTHDTHLMNTKILRRDQYWITDRDINGATNLFSIHDFEGRDSEDVEKRYFEGRYRGLPVLKGD